MDKASEICGYKILTNSSLWLHGFTHPIAGSTPGLSMERDPMADVLRSRPARSGRTGQRPFGSLGEQIEAERNMSDFYFQIQLFLL